MSERGNTLANSNVAEEEKPTTTIKTAFIKKKRKKKRNRNVRQTRTTLEEGDLAVDNPEEGQQAAAQDYISKIEATKFLQKSRNRRRGCGVSDVSTDTTTNTGGNGYGEGQEQGFADDFQKEEVEKNPETKQMEKYVQEQIDKRRGISRGKKSQNELSEMDKLYHYSDDLKVESGPVDATKEAGNRWLAGIAEVALPISEKIKNIEATEKAKMKFQLGRRDHDSSSSSSSSSTNYSANFKQHNRDYRKRAKEDREKREEEQRYKRAKLEGKPVSAIPKPSKGYNYSDMPTATDHRVAARFIRRNRYK